MPTNLVIAYVIFGVVPIGLAFSIAWRRCGVERKLSRRKFSQE